MPVQRNTRVDRLRDEVKIMQPHTREQMLVWAADNPHFSFYLYEAIKHINYLELHGCQGVDKLKEGTNNG